MKFKMKAAAAILAAAVLGTGLIASDFAAAQQSHDIVTKKRTAAKIRTCNLYGSGCISDWTTYGHGVDGDAATADVLVVGDSIVNACRAYLRLRLGTYGLTAVFDYWSSRPTADVPSVTSTPGAVTRTLSYSRLYQPDGFKAVAMLTGTNDIMVNPGDMANQVKRMQAVEVPLIWGTVYAGRTATLTADVRNSGWVNSSVASTGVQTSDWFGFLAAYPGYRIPNHVPDGVHPDANAVPVMGDGSGCDSWAAIHAPRISAVTG